MNRPAKLLYIEDDDLDWRMFARMVHDRGLPWEVQHADTLAAARALLSDTHFDVIVADCHLPDGESTELFGATADTPFVLLTGTLEEAFALRTLERGADDYLVKDPDHRVLETLPFTVEKTLYRKSIHDKVQRLARQLRESEERFAAFMDHLPGAAWIKDLHGRYVYANPEAQRIFSTPLHALQGKTDEEIFPPETARQFSENDQRVLGEDGSLQTTETLRQADGREHASLVSKFSVPGPDGRTAYVGGVAFDITEHMNTEKALRESEEKFRALAENAPTAIGIVQGTRFVYANRQFARLGGYSVQEILSMDFPQMVHPDFREMMIDRAQRRLRGEPVPDHYEFLMLTKGGESRWIDFSPALIEFQGKPAIIGTGLDVTDRKKAEEALRESEERSKHRAAVDEAIMASMAEGLYTVDTNGLVTYMNPAAERLLGFSSAELMGRQMHEMTHYQHPDGTPFPIEECPSFQVLHGGKILSNHEDVFIRKGGGFFPVVYSSAPVKLHDRVVGLVVLFRDVTAQKQTQEELKAAHLSEQQARAAAEEANQAKDRFLAVLSHELRTPLMPVLAAVSMLQKNPLFEGQAHKNLEMIRRNVEMEARLIDDLLDLTRIARGKIELDKRSVELCSVISRAVDVCRPDIEARRLNFGVDLGAHAPYIVEADVGRLQQVFWNLLKNSIKFTPHGGCVGIRCRAEDGHVVVEVNDSGMGIDPEVLPRLFNAFAQADRGITRQFGGLGLGLAISKSLVELHGGSIEAHSPGKGQGATFTVRLPLTAKPTFTGQQPVFTPELLQQRVLQLLVVEDHGDTADMIKLVLESEGHQVVLAGDVETALEKADRGGFDLLISDLGLPDGSGLDLMRELRARGHQLPGIALSGYGQEDDVHRSRDAGFIAHVIKPVDMEKLVSVLADVSSRASGRTPACGQNSPRK